MIRFDLWVETSWLQIFNLENFWKSCQSHKQNWFMNTVNELFSNQYLVKKIILNIKKGQNHAWSKIKDILSTWWSWKIVKMRNEIIRIMCDNLCSFCLKASTSKIKSFSENLKYDPITINLLYFFICILILKEISQKWSSGE